MADPYDGRRPSYDFTRNGLVIRGFRSRPGAPMHDPTNNLPISRDNSTPRSTWDEMFRKRPANNPSSVAANSEPERFKPFSLPMGETPASIYVDGALGSEDETTKIFNRQLSEHFSTLESMASGGMNHAQRWSQPAKPVSPRSTAWSPAPFMPRGPRDNFYVDNSGGFFGSPLSSTGWKTTSRREADAIGQKYSAKQPFGWGSAFKA